ncbi:MAG: hypothetical protein DRN14_04685 [Thermoplasmata archaeon]|nr:MAG: hypothetical protein DRN14_04685 [Thermoplasmata archaeon]
MRVRAKKLFGGDIEGEALVSRDPINFYLADPETGVYLEKNHSLGGKSLSGKVLIIPSGKGSSVVQLDGLYQLARHNNAPRAVIANVADAVLVSACVVVGVTLVHKPEKDLTRILRDGDWVIIKGDDIILGERNAVLDH